MVVTQAASYVDGPAGVHAVLDQAGRALAQLGDRHGLRTIVTDDVRTLSDDALPRARVLALLTIGETPWDRMQRAEITSRLAAGGLGVLAIHSAVDANHAWPAFGRVAGARFAGHPWTQTFTMDVLEPEHPATAHLGPAWTWHDEVYQLAELRDDARVLLRVRDGEVDPAAPGASAQPWGLPMAWCFTEGVGRVFGTSLGHFPAAWESPAYLRLLDGGLAWVLGDGA